VPLLQTQTDPILHTYKQTNKTKTNTVPSLAFP
jgi:hypothetical protein